MWVEAVTDEKFDGAGFSREPLSPDESARVRHMLREVSGEWLSLSNVNAVIRAVSIIGSAIKVAGPVMLTAAAFGLFLKSQGLLQ